MYARSSAQNRCIQSAHALITGLTNNFNNNLTVNVVHENEDILLASMIPKCHRFYRETKAMALAYNMTENWKPIFKYLTEHTGNHISSIYDAMIIFDSLKIESELNLV